MIYTIWANHCPFVNVPHIINTIHYMYYIISEKENVIVSPYCNSFYIFDPLYHCCIYSYLSSVPEGTGTLCCYSHTETSYTAIGIVDT